MSFNNTEIINNNEQNIDNQITLFSFDGKNKIEKSSNYNICKNSI